MGAHAAPVNPNTGVKEFKEIGHLRTAIRPYPMGDTAKVIAIGRCVPAYMARHVMAKTLKYTSGIASR